MTKQGLLACQLLNGAVVVVVVAVGVAVGVKWGVRWADGGAVSYLRGHRWNRHVNSSPSSSHSLHRSRRGELR